MSARLNSPAVMARRVEPPDSLDYFPTPPWATRALLERLEALGMIAPDMTAADPCCGRGHMVRPLVEYFRDVRPSDIFAYGGIVEDFLSETVGTPADWFFLNPPFKTGEQFILKALDTARIGVAALVRTAFLEGGGRYESIYRDTPPTGIFQFSGRVIMAKGICRNPDLPYWHTNPQTGAGEWRKPSTATAYCWMFWHHGSDRLAPEWITPDARKRLERPGDYDEHEQPEAGPLVELMEA